QGTDVGVLINNSTGTEEKPNDSSGTEESPREQRNVSKDAETKLSESMDIPESDNGRAPSGDTYLNEQFIGNIFRKSMFCLHSYSYAFRSGLRPPVCKDRHISGLISFLPGRVAVRSHVTNHPFDMFFCGIGLSSEKHSMVKEWIANHIPIFGANIEMRIKPSNARRIVSVIPRGWKFFATWEHHHTARIVVVWSLNVITTVYRSTSQAVTCGFFLPLESKYHHYFCLEMLNSTTPIVNHPWAILGDFNQIIRSVHHSNSQDLEVDVSGMENLNLATQKAQIFEAQYKGLSFTWWNNQEATPISKKINHAFINQEWANKFPDGYAEFLEPHQSDHAPWLFRLPSAQRRVPKPFKFFNHIVDHPLFEDTVRAAWHPGEIIGICQFKLVRSLKLLEKELRRINKTHYSGISQRVKDQGEIVSQLQRRLLTQPDPQPAFNGMTLEIGAQHFITRQWIRGQLKIIFTAVDGSLIRGIDAIKSHSADYFAEILSTIEMVASPISLESLQNLLPFRCSSSQIE
ncbi:LOW QUALITY PROTEIN: hypothetical protein HID58_055063, partial [Brassica napus]